MPTFIAAPHVARPARRLRDLAAQPTVAVTIDTETQPPQALSLRGQVVISEHDDVVAEYALAAHRYLGLLAATALFVVQLGRRIGWDNPFVRQHRSRPLPRWRRGPSRASRPLRFVAVQAPSITPAAVVATR
jgi:hypothetical protein